MEKFSSGIKKFVNKAAGKVEKKLVDNKYEPISSKKGWGGIPSKQDMYQARYDIKKNRGGLYE